MASMKALGIGLVVATAAGIAHAASPTSPDGDKKFAQLVGVEVVNAARVRGDSPRLLRFDVSRPKANRLVYSLRMEWFGGFTGKRYIALIDVKVDTSDGREILDIDYTDSCPFPSPNLTNVRELIDTLNQKLRK